VKLVWDYGIWIKVWKRKGVLFEVFCECLTLYLNRCSGLEAQLNGDGVS
jgi:hypothetical protein